MTTDLHRALADLAYPVEDPALPARLTGHVRPLVSRIRRRRAVAATGTSLAGLGLAAAGVLWLPGDGTPVTPAPLPAAGVLESAGAATDGVACGAPLPAAPVAQDGYALEVDRGTPTTVATGAPVDVALRLVTAPAPAAQVEASTPVALLVLEDGVLVGVHARDLGTGALRLGWEATSTGPQDLTASCDPDGYGEPLAPGDYTIVAAVTWTLADGTTVPLRSEGWPLTVTDSRPSPAPTASAPAAVEPGDELAGGTEAERQVTAIVDGEPAGPFPACGSEYPAAATGPVTASLALGPAPAWATEPLTGTVTLGVADGVAQVTADVPTSGGRLVYLRDGVVVGAGYWDPEEVDAATVSGVAQVALPVTGYAVLCQAVPTDAPGTPLPPGTYQAVGVVELALPEVTGTDGTTTSRSDLVQAVSDAVDVEVTGTFD